MGYLDNSTIVVDAILTKKQRKNMAQGQSFDVRYFCAADTSVDYRLYNENHPAGTNSYGEAITSMPNLEAHGNASYTLLNKLITLERGTTFLPTIIGVDDLYNFGSRIYTRTIQPEIHPAGSISGPEFMLVVSDDSLVNIKGCTPVGSYDSMILTHMAIEDVETVQACTGTRFGLEPKEVAEAHTLSAVIVELNMGIWNTFQISMTKNELQPVPKVTEKSSGGRAPMGD